MPSSIIGLSQNEVKLISGGRDFDFSLPGETPKKSWGALLFQVFEGIGIVAVVVVGVNEIRKLVQGRVPPHVA